MYFLVSGKVSRVVERLSAQLAGVYLLGGGSCGGGLLEVGGSNRSGRQRGGRRGGVGRGYCRGGCCPPLCTWNHHSLGGMIGVDQSIVRYKWYRDCWQLQKNQLSNCEIRLLKKRN